METAPNRETAPAGAADARPVLVFGATGFVASHLVPRLLRDGVRVRAAARRPEALATRDWPGVEIVRADALDPASLAPALAGVGTAYYLVHSMCAGRDFGRLEREAARHFGRAARAAGVEHVVYLGGLVADGEASEHVRSRRDTGSLLRDCGVRVLELRAGIIVGPGSAAFEVMRDVVLNLPLLPVPRGIDRHSPPIAIADLLEYLVELPRHPELDGGVLDLAGAERLSYRRMISIVAIAAGRRPPRVLVVPGLTPRLAALGLPLVSSVPFPLARALFEGLDNDFEADDARARALLPRALLGFEAATHAAFAEERAEPEVSRWVDGSFSIRARDLRNAFHAMRAGDDAEGDVSAAALWRVVCAIGGANRYYYANGLWTLREWIDALLGGEGRVRRHPGREPRRGDRIDSWTVIGTEPGRRLTLRFGMKAPGAGVLEFSVEALPAGRARVAVTAYWHPAGFAGLLYWYAMAPAHGLLFRGLTRRLIERARALDAVTAGGPDGTA